MNHHHFVTRLAVVTFSMLGIQQAAFADGGRIRFEGAIVEPDCSVQAAKIVFDTSKNTPKNKSNQVMLKMNCHTDQAVQISFDNANQASTRAFDSGVQGTEVSLSYGGKEIRPGQNIPLRLQGGDEKQLPLQAALRQSASQVGGNDKVRGAILVSLNYR